MKTLSQLSAVILGAAVAFAPALGMAQHSPTPETTIPRHTGKRGNGNFAPPPDRKMPPDTHHDIQAHSSNSKHAKEGKKGKNSSAGKASRGSAGEGI